MTLERIEHKVFASEAPLEEMGQFGSALATTKLNTKDVAEIQALPAYTQGWGSAIISENNYPAMEEMNGVLNVMSYHTGYLYQEGIPEYSATQTYSASSIVKNSNGIMYRSKKDNNIGNSLDNVEWFEKFDLDAKANTDLSNLSTAGQAKFNDKVSKSGDTMTGNLTIDNAKQAIITIDSDLAGLGSSPSGGSNTGSIYFKQKGVLTALIQNVALADGGNRLQLITRRPDNSGWGAGCNLATSATGASTFDFPRCTTKATTTSTASGSSVAVIVQNYKNGNSWYRVWSDGWIEQGGNIEQNTGTSGHVTFLKSFTASGVYTICLGLASSVVSHNCSVNNRANSGFDWYKSYNDTAVTWYACGY